MEVQTELLALLKEGKQVNQFQTGDELELMLAQSPFYAEGGGQVGDIGEVEHGDFLIQVTHTQSPAPGLIILSGKAVQVIGEGCKIKGGEQVKAQVFTPGRHATEANHTSTHLLQAAMRQVLGDHVKQAGSLVTPEKLRFDFSHYAPLTKEQIKDIEDLVNDAIRANEAVSAASMDYDTAIQTGAMAIFGEKYGDEVRVVTAGSSSKEFCGGCHVKATGDIGIFKIVTEEAISAGVRRIEALTGKACFSWIQNSISNLEGIAGQMKVGLDQVGSRFEQLLSQTKEREKELEILRKELSQVHAAKALDQVELINEVPFLELTLSPEADLKKEGPNYLAQLNEGVVMLSKQQEGKISVMLLVSKNLTKKIQAGKLIGEFAPLIEGKGGGKPEFAQCGGTKAEGFEDFRQAIRQRLAEG